MNSKGIHCNKTKPKKKTQKNRIQWKQEKLRNFFLYRIVLQTKPFLARINNEKSPQAGLTIPITHPGPRSDTSAMKASLFHAVILVWWEFIQYTDHKLAQPMPKSSSKKKRRAKAFKEWEGEEGIANGADRHTVISVPFWWPYKSTNYTRNGQRMLRLSPFLFISLSLLLQ